jgi:NAD(P)-dependent dehydrogenase (short-subunit alcohol dehydrogenase family)/acyl carrier protein
MRIVAEKTGYPIEMLSLDLDLEADLGIDTVKQAEMFAAVRQIFDIPRDADLKLRDFPTLAHIVRFVEERTTPPSGTEAPSEPELTPQEPKLAPQSRIEQEVMRIVADKTGYPIEMLSLDLDLEADLGIDTVKQAEMFAEVRKTFEIPRDADLKLRDFPTLAHIVKFVEERVAPPSGAEAPSELKLTPQQLKPGPQEAETSIPRRVPVPVLRPPLSLCKATGVALEGKRVLVVRVEGESPQPLIEQLTSAGAQIVNEGPADGVYWLDSDVKGLFATMKANPNAFLISATGMGGQHGYDEAGSASPLNGAVTGFTKAYKRENPNAVVKAVDFEVKAETDAIAAALIAETLCDPGAVEIGYRGGLRWTVGLEERSVEPGMPGLQLSKDSVFVITGAAGSIVSAITADLASASGGTFYLLDLAPEPRPDDSDLPRFATDRDGLKRDIFARIQARDGRATPAMVEQELAQLERVYAAWSAIEAIRKAGGAAQYFSVDLRDGAAVASVIDKVRQRSGHIDVLLHAAGLERSRMIADKTQAEFDLVFDVKVQGWLNLMNAIGDMPLRATVAFSSVAGRFGNAGQTDYSAANDLLCKIASSFRTARPETRAIAIDWTAWGGIGMATRGSIPKMMEAAGIEMLPPEIGVSFIRRELTAGGPSGEIVVAGKLGVMMGEFDEDGGVDANAAVAAGPMCGRVRAGIYSGIVAETTLDPKVQPFLNDHRIEGIPVLPGVMGIEAFAEAASAMLPGWRVEAVEDMRFIAPFKFYRDEPRVVAVRAVFRPDADGVAVECELIGEREIQGKMQRTVHFTGKVTMTRDPSAAMSGDAARMNECATAAIEAAQIYKVYFHGPAYQVLNRVWSSDGNWIGEVNGALPPNHWPVESPLLALPRSIELCFQTAGIAEIATENRMGLPEAVDRIEFHRAGEPQGTMYAIVTGLDAQIIDSTGTIYLTLTGYRTTALPGTVELSNARVLVAAN